MKRYLLFKSTLLLILLLLMCNCKHKPHEHKIANKKTEEPDCKKFYKAYNQKYVLEEADSALVYINKAIDCDPNNSSYKFTKVKFLTEIKRYSDALKEADNLSSISDDPAFKLFKGIIMLKMKNKDSDKILNEAYNSFSQIKEPTASNQFYKVALDSYIKGADYALTEIKELKERYKSDGYQMQNLTAIEELIRKENREAVLFKTFGINE